MKSFKRLPRYRPFQKLNELIDEHGFALATNDDRLPWSDNGVAVGQGREEIHDEGRLFEEAMKDVVPIEPSAMAPGRPKSPFSLNTAEASDQEVLASLTKLVDHGHGFVVSDTPEYMEGVGYGIDAAVASKLHRGDFAVQDHIDLHGLVVDEAKAAFDDFLHGAIISSKRTLLVIHGRGLSSAEEPVLKTKVKEWLTSGLWRKWIVAFSSARACDGGAGATYILLRRHPATKRHRKR